jgi:transcriptional regulator with XRE-family HTH domain
MTQAEQIKSLRTDSKLTVKQAADLAGTTLEKWNKIESGEVVMHPAMLNKFKGAIDKLKEISNKKLAQIKALRTDNNLSVKQASEMIGVSRDTWNKIETGEVIMHPAMLDKFKLAISKLPPKSKYERKAQPRKIVDRLKSSSQYDIKELVKKSKSWFNSEVKQLMSTAVVKGKNTFKPEIGTMYIFHYDAKHKATLPYWDKNPLIFIFNILEDGFLGINFHYLHYKDRIILLNALESIAYSNRTDVSTKLKLSYSVLQSVAKNKKYEKCIHRYLFTHLKTPLKKIHSDNWLVSCLLPNELFVGATANEIWSMK